MQYLDTEDGKHESNLLDSWVRGEVPPWSEALILVLSFMNFFTWDLHYSQGPKPLWALVNYATDKESDMKRILTWF